MVPVRLSVLDQSPIPAGSTGPQALANTIDLARLADQLGYHRYWVAEHHGGPTLAGPSPEALIGPIASATTHLRVGSGGVMLPHYSPFKVAETFSVLAGLFPGRIDLGLGRAAGTDPITSRVLQRDRRAAPPDDFPQQLAELLAFLEGTFPEDSPVARLSALPGLPEVPEPWLLGSSLQSAVWAAQLGLRYAFADFISPGGGDIARRYRDEFTHTGRLGEPVVAVAASVICADTEEEAQQLAASGQMAFSMLRRGRLIAIPPVSEALAWLEQRGERPGSPAGRRAILGSPETVRAGIEALAQEYGAGEVIIVTITHEHTARRRSYELIADVFGLAAPGPAAAQTAGWG